MNILIKANEIVNERKEEKERQYGPFDESMEKASKIASIISNKEITNDDMYICMIALKLSRQSFCKKEDNLLDLVAYVGAWQNKINKENNV
jgi:DNA-binding protein H-NS